MGWLETVPDPTSAPAQHLTESAWKVPEVPLTVPKPPRSQLQQCLAQFGDVFTQHDKDHGQIALIEHEIHMEGPPVHVPYHR